MKPELQKKLMDKYPKIFAQKDLPMTQTAMCWGIDCGDGWYWLIDNLCDTIQKYVDSKNESIGIQNKARKKTAKTLKKEVPGSEDIIKEEEEWQIEATQIKEKFGGLRFYTNYGDDEIFGIIRFAEHLSYKICEFCGTLENVKVRNKGWIFTLCDKCYEEKERKRKDEENKKSCKEKSCGKTPNSKRS